MVTVAIHFAQFLLLILTILIIGTTIYLSLRTENWLLSDVLVKLSFLLLITISFCSSGDGTQGPVLIRQAFYH